ncbi:MAG: hypothetical protein M5U26_19860 [Planctomycetota bacterium]|nr:hypothetical protein [Planctomycetota bacterium]
MLGFGILGLIVGGIMWYNDGLSPPTCWVLGLSGFFSIVGGLLEYLRGKVAYPTLVPSDGGMFVMLLAAMGGVFFNVWMYQRYEEVRTLHEIDEALKANDPGRVASELRRYEFYSEAFEKSARVYPGFEELIERGNYRLALKDGTVASFADFQRRFPDSRLMEQNEWVDALFARLEDLEQGEARDRLMNLLASRGYSADSAERMERLEYEQAARAGTFEAYFAFRDKHPGSARLEDLDHALFRKLDEAGALEGYERYLEAMYAGAHRDDATMRIEKCHFESALRKATLDAYLDFKMRYPGSVFLRRKDLDDAIYRKLEASGSLADHQAYLREFPDGAHSDEALARLDRVRDKLSQSMRQFREAVARNDAPGALRILDACAQDREMAQSLQADPALRESVESMRAVLKGLSGGAQQVSEENLLGHLDALSKHEALAPLKRELCALFLNRMRARPNLGLLKRFVKQATPEERTEGRGIMLANLQPNGEMPPAAVLQGLFRACPGDTLPVNASGTGAELGTGFLADIFGDFGYRLAQDTNAASGLALSGATAADTSRVYGKGFGIKDYSATAEKITVTWSVFVERQELWTRSLVSESPGSVSYSVPTINGMPGLDLGPKQSDVHRATLDALRAKVAQSWKRYGN